MDDNNQRDSSWYITIKHKVLAVLDKIKINHAIDYVTGLISRLDLALVKKNALFKWVGVSFSDIKRRLQHPKRAVSVDERNENPSDPEDYVANIEKTINFNSPKSIYYILMLIAVIILTAVIWASLAVSEEVTSTRGKVVSAQHVQSVQSLNGGVINDIFVKEGQYVTKDEVLFSFENKSEQAAHDRSVKREIFLTVKLARINAEIKEQNDFAVSQTMQEAFPKIIKHEKELLVASLDKYHSSIYNYKQQQHHIEKELDLVKPLVESKTIAYTDQLRLEKQLKQVEGQIDTLKDQFISDALEARSQTDLELFNVNQQLAKEKVTLERTRVHSPVNGVINNLFVHTKGQAISRVSTLAEIVPADSGLSITTQVTPSDIGFLKVGQEAIISIDAYDAGVYGTLRGTVVKISKDTIQEANAEPYYRVDVDTPQDFIMQGTKKHFIIPGMTLNVSIVTRKVSVLSLIVSPIAKALSKSLKE